MCNSTAVCDKASSSSTVYFQKKIKQHLDQKKNRLVLLFLETKKNRIVFLFHFLENKNKPKTKHTSND